MVSTKSFRRSNALGLKVLEGLKDEVIAPSEFSKLGPSIRKRDVNLFAYFAYFNL